MATTLGPVTRPTTIHQHPLAYLLGLEGVALMRAFAGEHDRAFTEERLDEIRSLLDRTDELGPGVDVAPMSAIDAYEGWASTYDGEDNGCFPLQDELLLPLLDRLAPGDVLDVACGTGRVSAQLVERRHRVTGVDASPGMLAHARREVPGARFVCGDLAALPVPDDEVDHVTCTLALAHVEHLGPFFAEAARVMRPGGHLLVTDTRGHFTGSSRYPLVKQDVGGRVGYVPGWSHATGDYLRAALPHGFLVRECEEAYRDVTVDDDEVAEPLTAGLPPDVWELHPWAGVAANAARERLPALIVWDFELAP